LIVALYFSRSSRSTSVLIFGSCRAAAGTGVAGSCARATIPTAAINPTTPTAHLVDRIFPPPEESLSHHPDRYAFTPQISTINDVHCPTASMSRDQQEKREERSNSMFNVFTQPLSLHEYAKTE
jgi:hypothetical protein